MADLITLEEAKLHLRVTNSSEDSLIGTFIEGVEEWITKFLNAAIPGITDSPPAPPSAIKCAALLMVADLYENRQAQVAGVQMYANPSAIALLYPYRTEIGI
jgi:hypothetical protein